jgi:uncharacterized protein (TIGR02231 family)
MRLAILALCLGPTFVTIGAPTAALADSFLLNSQTTSVTLYPQGATLIREVPFTIPAGTHDLILTDLPQNTPLDRIRVELTGASLGSVTARRENTRPDTGADSPDIQRAESIVEVLGNRLRDEMSAITLIRLNAEAAQARVAFLQQLGTSEATANMDVTTLRQLAGMIGEETLIARTLAHDATNRADTAERGLDQLRTDLAQAEQNLAALRTASKANATLTVSATSDTESTGTLTVSYLHDAAGWAPVYDMRLDRNAGRLAIERGAFITQNTGEDWRDIALTLSTVRPSGQLSPSYISPLLRRVEDPEKVLPMATARLRDSAQAGAMVVMEAPSIEASTNISFDGLAVTYAYPGTVDVANGADRVRLALGKLETGARSRVHAAPLWDDTGFLMAEILNDTGELILPTPFASLYLDGRYVGQTGIDDVIPAGATADLPFGAVDGLRLTRTVNNRNEGDRGVFTRATEFSEEVTIEIENLTGETWPVELFDRVPYSEQDDLDIRWTATPNPTSQDVDGRRGVLMWTLNAAPGGKTSIKLSHEMEWPEDKILR